MTANMDVPTAPGATSQPTRSPGTASEPRDRGPAGQRTSLTLLILVFVGFISLGLPDGLLGVAWPSIRQTFGLPLDALGALFLTTVCGYLAASLTSGWVVQRIGVGWLLTLSALATSVSLLTFALTPSWALIVLAGILAGLGSGAIDAGLNSYVALAHGPRLLSWLHACFGVGAATGPAIMMAVLNAGQSWRLGYAIVGAGQLLLGLCFLLTRRQWQMTPASLIPHEPPTPRPPPPHAGEGENTGGLVILPSPLEGRGGAAQPMVAPRSGPLVGREGPGVRSLVAWPLAIWLSIVLFLVYTGIETAAGQWAYTLFVEGRGISAQAAGVGVSAYWGALAIGRVLAGLVADRVAPATLTRWSMVGMLMGAVLIWLDLTVWLSFAGLVLIGLAAAPVFPSLIGVTPLRFGSKQAPTIIGFQVGAAALGIAGLPALAGVLAARVGLEVIPLLLVVASAGMVALHETVLRLARRPLPPWSDDRGEPE
jgi:fucose permease